MLSHRRRAWRSSVPSSATITNSTPAATRWRLAKGHIVRSRFPRANQLGICDPWLDQAREPYGGILRQVNSKLRIGAKNYLGKLLRGDRFERRPLDRATLGRLPASR